MYYQDPGTELEAAPQDQAGALEYIRSRWAAFATLDSDMRDLMHRAALAKQAAVEMGDSLKADTAALLLQELKKLQNVHHQIVTWAERAGAMAGLGAVQIPVGIAGVSVVALLVAWTFRKYAAQKHALELLEAGVLTPAEFKALDIMDPPGIGAELAGMAGGIGKWILLIVLALAVLEVTKQKRFFENPPLLLFGNPGPMSKDVYFLAYEHADDGEPYLHEFEGGVELHTLENGSVVLEHPEKEIWRDFK